MASASIASAHHCYKVDWNDAAYEHVSSGTAWWTLNDLGAMIITQDLGLPQCAYVAEELAVPPDAFGGAPGSGRGARFRVRAAPAAPTWAARPRPGSRRSGPG